MELFRTTLLSLLTLFTFNSINARRMNTKDFVKQELTNCIKHLESRITLLEETKKYNPPQGSTITPYSKKEIEILDQGIAKLKAAIKELQN